MRLGSFQALALMKASSAVLIALTLLSFGCASRPQISSESPIEKLFFARLKQLSGADARACGVVPLKDLSSPAASAQSRTLACSKQALIARNPFWAAFRIPGYEDTSFWEGIALTPDGRVIKVTYQHDLFDPGMEQTGGRVREFTCQATTLSSGNGSVVVCEVSANQAFKPKPLRGSV